MEHRTEDEAQLNAGSTGKGRQEEVDRVAPRLQRQEGQRDELGAVAHASEAKKAHFHAR